MNSCGITVVKKLTERPHCNGCHEPQFVTKDGKYVVTEVTIGPKPTNLASVFTLCSSCASAFAARIHNVRFMRPNE